MQTRNRILDDLAKVAGGALSVMTGVKSEAEAVMRQQFEKVLDKMDLIPREDFEAMRTMAAKARDQQEELVKRVAVLEKKLGVKPAPKKARPKKVSPKKAAAKKTAPKKTIKSKKKPKTKGAKS